MHHPKNDPMEDLNYIDQFGQFGDHIAGMNVQTTDDSVITNALE